MALGPVNPGPSSSSASILALPQRRNDSTGAPDIRPVRRGRATGLLMPTLRYPSKRALRLQILTKTSS